MKAWFVTKSVDMGLYPDYNPNDFRTIFSKLDQNPHLDQADYRKRLGNLPAHVKKAWLEGEFVNEGAYFEDFMPTRESKEWHVITKLPNLTGASYYRAMDWGWYPDPACCLWIAVVPNGRAIVFKEWTATRTTVPDAASQIKSASSGLRIVMTLCDPTMFAGSEATGNSIGDTFIKNGVPLTESKNDRSAAGFAIHEWLNQVLPDGLPKLQIFGPACPKLVQTLPEMEIDTNDPSRIADGPDHWVISLAYWAMAGFNAPKPLNSRQPVLPKWLKPKRGTNVLGRHQVRRR
jgi:hypothetical protein